MKKTFHLWMILIFSVNSYHSQIYIENVTVVDVIHKKLVPDQTVVFSGKPIIEIKPSRQIKIPQNSHVIDGKGKYLIPGMTDSHVHFFQSGGLYTRPDALDLRKHVPYEKEIRWSHNQMEDLLQRYLKMGITSVIDPGATYNLLKLRDSLQENIRLPSVYMSGPLITTYEPEVFKNLNKDEPFRLLTSIDDAKKLVQEQLPYKPDFIKIWYIVTGDADKKKEQTKKLEPAIKAVIDEAHKNNLKVAVHATERFTAETAVQNGADYLVHNIEDEIISNDFVKLLKSKKVIVSPTLTVMDHYYDTYGQKIVYDTYELENSNPESIGSMYDLKHLTQTSDSAMLNKLKTRFNTPKVKAYISKMDSIRRVNLKKLSDGGVTIAAGTDAGNIGTQHGSSFMAELKAMKASGMTEWQILQSATINPAKILNKEKDFGSIEVGKAADLVVLNSNPVENLGNLSDISAIFRNGMPIDVKRIVQNTPENLVQQQVNGYNARNIDAFMEPYAEDVELYIFPSKLISKGKEAMRKIYVNLFSTTPDLHCEITQRIVNDRYIVDKENITGQRPGIQTEATAIYEIKDDKISKVYFLSQKHIDKQ